MNPENIQYLTNHFHVSTISELYFRIAKGKVDLSKLRELEVIGGMLQSQRKIQSKKSIVVQKKERSKESIPIKTPLSLERTLKALIIN